MFALKLGIGLWTDSWSLLRLFDLRDERRDSAALLTIALRSKQWYMTYDSTLL